MTYIVFTNCTIVAVSRTIIRRQPRWFHSGRKTLLWMRFRPSPFRHGILQHIVFVWNFHFFLMTSATSNRGRPRKISSCRSLFQFVSDKLPQWRDTPTFCAYEWLQGRSTTTTTTRMCTSGRRRRCTSSPRRTWWGGWRTRGSGGHCRGVIHFWCAEYVVVLLLCASVDCDYVCALGLFKCTTDWTAVRPKVKIWDERSLTAQSSFSFFAPRFDLEWHGLAFSLIVRTYLVVCIYLYVHFLAISFNIK